MSVFPDAPSMGTGGSPLHGAIILNIEQLLDKAMSSGDLANLFKNLKIIEAEWNFTTNPKFGTNTGFLKSTTGILSFETLADVATSNDYDDLDNKPAIPTTLTDLGSPTSPYNFGNQDLKNVSSLLIGSNTASGYNSAIRNIQPIVNFLGTDKGHMCLENGYTYAGNQDKYLAIDFQPQLNWDKPTARIACQNTDSGSFLVLGTSDIFADGITKICATFAKFYTENTTGIKVNESVLFENSGGVIGNSTAYPDDITALNAQTIMSDPKLKIINENKLDFSFDFLEKMVDSIISWKWKPKKIEAKRKTKLVKNEILNKKTKLIETQYDFITEITEEEKIKEHSSSHIGFDLSKFYKFFTESGFRTKDFNFFRIAATYKKLEINPETLEEKEIEISSFDENGDPILDKNGSPFGAMSYKPTELQPLAFMYINKLHEKIKNQEKRLDDLEKQMKILLKK